jgi:hypothetical protein
VIGPAIGAQDCGGCLEKLRLPEGQGPITIKDNKIVPPLRAEMKRSMEATLRNANASKTRKRTRHS